MKAPTLSAQIRQQNRLPLVLTLSSSDRWPPPCFSLITVILESRPDPSSRPLTRLSHTSVPHVQCNRVPPPMTLLCIPCCARTRCTISSKEARHADPRACHIVPCRGRFTIHGSPLPIAQPPGFPVPYFPPSGPCLATIAMVALYSLAVASALDRAAHTLTPLAHNESPRRAQPDQLIRPGSISPSSVFTYLFELLGPRRPRLAPEVATARLPSRPHQLRSGCPPPPHAPLQETSQSQSDHRIRTHPLFESTHAGLPRLPPPPPSLHPQLSRLSAPHLA